MADELDKYLDQFKPKKPKAAGDDSVARVLDDEFAKLGYGDTARLSILGDVGRENAWNRQTIFGGHNDPKNNARNRGIISWQGDRSKKLDNHLKKEGVLGRGDDDELRGMARFMDSELQSDFPDVHKKLKGAKGTYEASEALRQYIKYVPTAPYNSPDDEFRVKNNADWAKRARSLGLAQKGLDDYLDNLKGGTAKDPLDDYLDNIGQPTPTNPSQQPLQTGLKPLLRPGQPLATETAEMPITVPEESPVTLPVTNLSEQALPTAKTPQYPPKRGIGEVFPNAGNKITNNQGIPPTPEQSSAVPQQDEGGSRVIEDSFDLTVPLDRAPKNYDERKEFAVQRLIPQVANKTGLDPVDVEKEIRQWAGTIAEDSPGITFSVSPQMVQNIVQRGEGKRNALANVIATGQDLTAEDKNKISSSLGLDPREIDAALAGEGGWRYQDAVTQGAANKQFFAAKHAEHAASLEQGEPVSIAQIRAAADVGWLKKDEADKAIAKEQEIAKNLLAENRISAKLDLRGIGQASLGTGTLGGGPVETQADYAALNDILKKYGTLANYEKEQKDLVEKYGYLYAKRPLAPALEFAKRFGNAVPQAVSSILETIAIAGEASTAIPAAMIDNFAGTDLQKQLSAENSPVYQVGKKFGAYFEDLKNRDFDDNMLVSTVADSLGQITVQMLAGVATGGAALPTLIGSAMGASQQYEEAAKFTQDPKARLAAAAVGAAAAVPDALLFNRWLKGLPDAGKTSFLNNLTKTIYSNLGIQFGDQAAEQMTRVTLASFAKNLIPGSLGEGVQEVSENKINDAVALAVYDRSEARKKKLLSINKEDIGSFIGGLVGGAGGAAVQTRIEQVNQDRLETALEFLPDMVEAGTITAEQAAAAEPIIAEELKQRKKGSPRVREVVQLEPETGPKVNQEPAKASLTPEVTPNSIEIEGIKTDVVENPQNVDTSAEPVDALDTYLDEIKAEPAQPVSAPSGKAEPQIGDKVSLNGQDGTIKGEESDKYGDSWIVDSENGERVWPKDKVSAPAKDKTVTVDSPPANAAGVPQDAIAAESPSEKPTVQPKAAEPKISGTPVTGEAVPVKARPPITVKRLQLTARVPQEKISLTEEAAKDTAFTPSDKQVEVGQKLADLYRDHLTDPDNKVTRDRFNRALSKASVGETLAFEELRKTPKVDEADELRTQAADLLVKKRNFDPGDAKDYVAKLGGKRELQGFIDDNVNEPDYEAPRKEVNRFVIEPPRRNGQTVVAPSVSETAASETQDGSSTADETQKQTAAKKTRAPKTKKTDATEDESVSLYSPDGKRAQNVRRGSENEQFLRESGWNETEPPTETDDAVQLERLPKKYAGQGLTADEVADQVNDPEFKAAEEASKKQKASPATGFTKAQQGYLIKELEEYAAEYPEGADYAGNKTGLAAGLLPPVADSSLEYRSKDRVKPETIIVPDDGTVTINDLKQANRLYQRLSGKPIRGQEKEKLGNKSMPSPPSDKPTGLSTKRTLSDIGATAKDDFQRGETRPFQMDVPIDEVDTKYLSGNKKLEAAPALVKNDGRFGSGWLRTSLGGKKAWTDGHMLIVADEAPGTGTTKQEPDSEKVLKLAQGTVNLKPVRPMRAVEGKDDALIEFDDGWQMPFEQYQLIKAHYPTVIFEHGEAAEKDQARAFIAYDGKDVVGLIMPVSDRDDSTAKAAKRAERYSDSASDDTPNVMLKSVAGNDLTPIRVRLSKFITRWLDGQIRSSEYEKVLDTTPDVYQRFGFADAPFILRGRLLSKTFDEKHANEGITRRQIERLALELDDPVALFPYKDERTGVEGMNVLTGMVNALGDPIVVGVVQNVEVGRNEVHDLKTIHGKTRTAEEWIKSPLYVNKGKAALLATTVPKIGKVVQQASRPSSTILTEEDFVNKKDEDRPLKSVLAVDPSQNPFYSQLERTIEAKMPAKASADQVRGIIKDTKAEEREWLGIDEFLDSKPSFTKDEVLAFVRENNVDVQEVLKGDGFKPGDIILQSNGTETDYKWKGQTGTLHTFRAKIANEHPVYEEHGQTIRPGAVFETGGKFFVTNTGDEFSSFEDAKKAVNDIALQRFEDEGLGDPYEASDTKYGSYTLPGGENYRELLIMMPEERSGAATGRFEVVRVDGEVVAEAPTREQAEAMADQLEAIGVKTDRSKVREQLRLDSPPPYKSGHFDEPNILAHLRFDERTVDGKKTLHIAEIQSDWSQAQRQGKDVPKTPFGKTDSWAGLAFKKALRYAVENDFDAVSWDVGATQAERYDLSKHIDTIKWQRKNDGTYSIIAAKDGSNVISKPGLTAEKLSDTIGKELTESIVNNPDDGGVIEGAALKTGGQGMQGFYDQILPAFVNKYVKKWNGKVAESTLSDNALRIRKNNDAKFPYSVISTDEGREVSTEFRNLASAEDYLQDMRKVKTVPVHSLTITPEMQKSVLAGQPLFKAREDGSIQAELKSAHTEDVLTGQNGGEIKGSDLELNEHDAEELRRIMGEKYSRENDGDEMTQTAFDGITWSSNYIRGLTKLAKEIRADLIKAGYTDEELAGRDRLYQNLDKLAEINENHAIAYVYDDALPEEQFHKEDLDAGRTTPQAVIELKKSPFWKDSGVRFNREYPGISDADRASEIAAKLATGQAEKYGWDHAENFEEEKQRFLETWADGIIDRNAAFIEENGFEAFAAKFERLAQYATTKTSTETEKDGSKVADAFSGSSSETTGPPDDQTEETEEAESGPDRRYAAGRGVDYEPSGAVKKSKTPKTLRKNDIPLGDRTYVSATNAGQQLFADQKLDEGVDQADEWLSQQIKDNNLNSGATTVVGINLMQHYAKSGDFDALNRVGDELIPMITQSAQAVQAMAILSMYSPESAAAYVTKVVKQRTGADITKGQVEKAIQIAVDMHDNVQEAAISDAALAEIEKNLSDLLEERESLTKALDVANDAGRKLKTDLSAARRTITNLKKRESKPARTRTSSDVKKKVDDIQARKDEILASIRQKFGESTILKMVSGAKALDTPLKAVASGIDQDLLDWSVLHLSESLGKITPDEFKIALNALTNQNLSPYELDAIHAAAVTELQTGKTLDDGQKAINKLRQSHFATARKFFASEVDKLFPQSNDKAPDKLTTNIISEGVKGDYTDEAIWFALARKTYPNETDAIKALEKEFPDLTPSDVRKTLVAAQEVYVQAKKAVRDAQIQAQNQWNLEQADVELIKEEKRINLRERSKIARDANRFYAGLSRTKGEIALDTVVNLRRANLLTGIKTHLVNITGNSVFGASEEVSQGLGWLADVAASGITGERTLGFANPVSVWKSFKALVKQDETLEAADRDAGVRAAYEYLRYGGTFADLERLQHSESLLGEKFPKLRWMDFYINSVYRTLGAEDALFKVYAFRRSLEDQAGTLAATEHREDKSINVSERKRELIKKPTNAMIALADSWAEFATFQNGNRISDWVSKIKKLHPGLKATIETIMPYDRTPTNIVIRTLEYAPGVGLILAAKKAANIRQEPSKEFRNALTTPIREDYNAMDSFLALSDVEKRKIIESAIDKAWTRRQQEIFARSFGRASLGSGLFTVGFFLAAAGLLAGSVSPEDDDRKETAEFFERRKAGIENRSLLIPGYGRFVLPKSPPTDIMAAGATFFEQMQTRKDPLIGSLRGAAESGKDIVFEQPLLGNFSNLFRTASKGNVGAFTGQLMGGYVPTIVSDVGEVIDEKPRASSAYRKEDPARSKFNWRQELDYQGRGFTNALYRRIPGVRTYVDESTGTVSQEERGGWQRRMLRMVDIFNTRSPVPYSAVKPKASMDEYLKSGEFKKTTTDDLVSMIQMDPDMEQADREKLVLALKKKVANARKGGTFTQDEANRVNSILPEEEKVGARNKKK